MVLTHRFVFTKDVYYLCTIKAKWSFVSDSNGGFHFTKVASSRLDQQSMKWSGSRESDPFLNLGKVSYCQYTRAAKLWVGTQIADLSVTRLRVKALFMLTAYSRKLGASCENRIRFSCLEGKCPANRPSSL